MIPHQLWTLKLSNLLSEDIGVRELYADRPFDEQKFFSVPVVGIKEKPMSYSRWVRMENSLQNKLTGY